MNKNATDSEPYQGSNLWLQIIQLNNLLRFVAGGLAFFLALYIEHDPIRWPRAIPFLWVWLALLVVWFITLSLIYSKNELRKRFLSYINSFFKWAIPALITCLGLYLALFPLEFRKTLGIVILTSLLVFKYANNASRVLPSRKAKTRSKSRINKNVLRRVTDWVATETNNEQGTDYREIDLQGGLVNSLSFKVKPSSTFWRAGFKITNQQGTILPLRTDKSLLFHVGSNESKSKFGITAYRDGRWVSSVNKLVDFDTESFISIKFEYRGGFIACFINNNVELKYKVADFQILSKLFLSAWGDGNPYRVEFVDIEYSIKS